MITIVDIECRNAIPEHDVAARQRGRNAHYFAKSLLG